MNSASHAHFAQYIDDIVPDELSAVGETGQASFSNQLSNLRTRLSNVRLAQMGLPTGGDILDGMVAQSISELQNDDQWTDDIGNGQYDFGEEFTDSNGNGIIEESDIQVFKNLNKVEQHKLVYKSL